MGVTDAQKNLLNSSVSILKENGKEITTNFYQTMFKEHPELRNFFNETNQKTGKQPIALAQTFYHFIKHLDNMDPVMAQLQRISNKHRALTVKPEHYPIVGKYLMQAIKEFLGDKATPEVMEAWQAAYDTIAQVFINNEKQLYSQLGNNEYEQGFIPYTIVKQEIIATGPIVNMVLVREDGGKLFNYEPGQYLSVRVEKNGVLHHGQYSLLEPYNGKTYSVAFKKGENVDQNSIVTNEILKNYPVGSTLLASPPSGTSRLIKDAKSQVFISGGIGIAAFMAMIEQLVKEGKTNSVTLIQCVRTKEAAAFSDKLSKLLPANQYTILTQDHMLSKKDLQEKINADTHVYVCGGDLFLNIAENALADFALPAAQLHLKSIEPTLRHLTGL